ncbi:IclR family transcriptional regulator [Shinella sp. 838]|uniref:IclR family transcriptional regulator n=1 Tax=Shinella sp. 838 TaxID=3038164 RepID=UPI00241530D4|nr:IclR family transcriptional regulator [Shinella sp. 838]MDG4674823.1 IclR family transcriptional regulator [Shinella sp. 838]
MTITRKPVRSVLRAAAVIEAIGSGAKGVTAIAEQIGLSKGTVFDLLKTLEMAGFVRQSQEGDAYQLGPVLLRLAAVGLSQVDLVAVAAPHLQALSDDTGEICHLGRRDGFSVVYLHRAKSQHLVRMLDLNSLVGARSPLHCTSMGKIALAHMTDEEFEDFLVMPREAYTERTITDPAALQAERERVREQGYALNLGEYEEGVHSVAVPLRTSSGSVRHGINFAMPSVRMPKASIPNLVERLQKTSAAIEKDIGI